MLVFNSSNIIIAGLHCVSCIDVDLKNLTMHNACNNIGWGWVDDIVCIFDSLFFLLQYKY